MYFILAPKCSVLFCFLFFSRKLLNPVLRAALFSSLIDLPLYFLNDQIDCLVYEMSKTSEEYPSVSWNLRLEISSFVQPAIQKDPNFQSHKERNAEVVTRGCLTLTLESYQSIKCHNLHRFNTAFIGKERRCRRARVRIK